MMDWVDELTLAEHLSFLKKIERPVTEFEDAISGYEADQLFERVRVTPDEKLLSLCDGEGDSLAVFAKMIELRHRTVLALEKKKEDREFTMTKLRALMTWYLGSVREAGEDFITFMGYCEYVSLRKQGDADALNMEWEEWQKSTVIKHALDSFYRRVADQRKEHWLAALAVEQAKTPEDVKAKRAQEPAPKPADIPLGSK